MYCYYFRCYLSVWNEINDDDDDDDYDELGQFETLSTGKFSVSQRPQELGYFWASSWGLLGGNFHVDLATLVAVATLCCVV